MRTENGALALNNDIIETHALLCFKVSHCLSHLHAARHCSSLLSTAPRASHIYASSHSTLPHTTLQGSYQLHTLVEAGHTIGTPAPLINPISDELIEQLRGR